MKKTKTKNFIEMLVQKGLFLYKAVLPKLYLRNSLFISSKQRSTVKVTFRTLHVTFSCRFTTTTSMLEALEIKRRLCYSKITYLTLYVPNELKHIYLHIHYI